MIFGDRSHVAEQPIALRIPSGFCESDKPYLAHEEVLSRNYRTWRGRCGRTYMFSVYSPFDCPAYENAVLIVAKRDADRRGEMLECLDLGRFPDVAMGELRARFSERLHEVDFQIHVLADRDEDRRFLIEDVTYARLDA